MYTEISEKEAVDLLNQHTLGGAPKKKWLFYDKTHDLWIAIDNRSGDFWVDEFKTKDEAERWLEGSYSD